jgi:uncharacterized membrane protein YfcA
MLGSGGSILTVPLLRLTTGLTQPEAEATSLPIVGVVAAAGFLLHLRHGAVAFRDALPFAAASLVAAFVAGRWLAPLLPHAAHTLAFAGLMLFVAARMALAKGPADGERERRGLPGVLAVGLLVGALTGLLGMGGGFVIVPALVLMLGFDVRRAVGTSLAVIALNCVGGLLGRVRPDGTVLGVAWGIAAVFSAVAVAGALAGGLVSHRLPQRALRRTFAVLVVAMAAVLLHAEFG